MLRIDLTRTLSISFRSLIMMSVTLVACVSSTLQIQPKIAIKSYLHLLRTQIYIKMGNKETTDRLLSAIITYYAPLLPRHPKYSLPPPSFLPNQSQKPSKNCGIICGQTSRCGKFRDLCFLAIQYSLSLFLSYCLSFSLCTMRGGG